MIDAVAPRSPCLVIDSVSKMPSQVSDLLLVACLKKSQWSREIYHFPTSLSLGGTFCLNSNPICKTSCEGSMQEQLASHLLMQKAQASVDVCFFFTLTRGAEFYISVPEKGLARSITN